MTIKIKICGLRDADMAAKIVALGADYIGILCYHQSVRYVTPQVGAEIAQAVVAAGGIPVAVCVDTDATTMLALCQQMGIHTVQLAGSVSRQDHKKLPYDIRRIYVLHVASNGMVQPDEDQGLAYLDNERDYILYDGMSSGSGRCFDLDNFQHPYALPFFLAGGLTIDNVATAINTVKPNAVDVSSGVELKPGHKDIDKVKRFINAVRETVN